MRPLLITAHRKPITWLKFSKEGDLLFIGAKDGEASIFFTETGEMLGNFHHTGAVACIDASDDCTRAVTASSNNEAIIWNVRNGERLVTYDQRSPARFVQFSEGFGQFLCVCDKGYGLATHINIYDVVGDVMSNDAFRARNYNGNPALTIHFDAEDKINCALWGPLNKTIICAMGDGSIRMYDAVSGDKLGSVKEHHGSVNKIAFNKDKTLLISASSDMTAKLFESKTLELLKTYRASEPLNSAALSPIKKHVVLGGGTQAQDVTTTLARSTTFDLHFYQLVFEEEFGKIKGHFGPINHITFSPDGKTVASGGEDGFVRIFNLTEDGDAYISLPEK